MTEKHKKSAILYRCPKCGENIMSVEGIFTLSGDMFKIKCPCEKENQNSAKINENYVGERSFTLTKLDKLSDKIQISAPCIFCAKEHKYSLKSKTLDGELLTLLCPLTGYEIVFIGIIDEIINASDHVLKEICEKNENGEV